MLRKRVKRGLAVLGLGALLTVSAGAWGMDGATAQASMRPYTGQVVEIKIDQCGLEPGTCEGSLILAQPGGQQVALAIPSGTAIQRADQLVRLEEVGIGNYVTVQAAPLPSKPLEWDESRVGTSAGERPLRLDETNGE
jgi:hypothetical protein